MQYPSLRDYQNAIVNQNNFNIPFFQSESLEIFLNPRGYPFMFVGGFGAIFKFRDKNKREYAFKVFTRDVKDRAKRYEALHKTLQITQFPFMADFHYVHEGFTVKGVPYPVVVMEWGRGLQLDAAIEQDLADDGIFQCAPHFAGDLFTIVKTLQEWNMGHNDLQEGNILVRDDNKLVLIDYDGMFVPLLKDEPPCEMGLRNYQHPARDKTHFNNKIDDFALISILYQLSIITPELWQKHHDDRRLLLKEADYKNPEQSELIQNGMKAEEPHVRALASHLVEACSLHPLEINAIEKIGASPEITDWLVLPEKPDPMPDFKSVIEWALALKSGQVKEYEADQIESPAAEVEKIKPVKPRKEGKGRWKPLNDYIAAGKKAAAKAARQRKAAVPEPPSPKPPPKTVRSRVKPVPVTPPAPQKKSFLSKLVTFFTLLLALALSRIKSSKPIFRNAIISFTLISLATCAYILVSEKKVTHPRRSEPKVVSGAESKNVFRLDRKGRPEQYVPITWNRFQKIKNSQVVKDRSTGLMWQKAGSKYMKYGAAQKYVKKLNSNNFAGYNDWRLPTTDELTSLLTKTKQDGGLYISSIFDQKQRWCWSSDRDSSMSAWLVYFGNGNVKVSYFGDSNYVRLVRAGQDVPIKERKKSVEKPEPTPNKTRLVNSLGIEFVYIPPGEFMMGSLKDEPGHYGNERRHKVVLSHGFYMQTVEVTQGQWKKVMDDNPSRFTKCGDNCPVENVSWEDVQKFIKKLNHDAKGAQYRLPTEAQWEYACRAGTQTPFAFGKCLSVDQANYNGNQPLSECAKGEYRQKTVPVRSFKPNTWGLYDMHGNVWEWCQDWYGDYPKDAVITDPTGPPKGTARVLRGGSWFNTDRKCRTANRERRVPSRPYGNVGFRLVRLAES
ncbi:SUMF1/EgtB/PvdO family nonheme iron enzyme [Desulfococcaceae bacterium HSG9]|nr:SUMF1/EgtB/PvdO family nonheme iron enzyme [Desulfococcaceae bacterium HSG9]